VTGPTGAKRDLHNYSCPRLSANGGGRSTLPLLRRVTAHLHCPGPALPPTSRLLCGAHLARTRGMTAGAQLLVASPFQGILRDFRLVDRRQSVTLVYWCAQASQHRNTAAQWLRHRPRAVQVSLARPGVLKSCNAVGVMVWLRSGDGAAALPPNLRILSLARRYLLVRRLRPSSSAQVRGTALHP